MTQLQILFCRYRFLVDKYIKDGYAIKSPEWYNEWFGKISEYATICYVAEREKIPKADMDNIKCFIDTSEW